MNRKSLLFLCLISLILSSLMLNTDVRAAGEKIFVSPDGEDTDTCEQDDPCDFVTGIALADHGDTVYFKGGTYTGTVDVNPLLNVTKGISLYGGWDGVAAGTVRINPNTYVTTLDGEDARRLMVINVPNDEYPVLINGFRLEQGDTGLLISSGETGGAIHVINGEVTIESNQFLDNYAGDYGGAIFTRSTYDVTIRDNVFTENETQYGGGAIFVGRTSSGNPNIIIEGNQFFSNISSYGDAVSVDSMPVQINRNLIKDSIGSYAISISSAGAEPSMISNNIIINSVRAVDFANESNGSQKVWNNTIVSATVGAITGFDTASVDIVNNIIVNSGYSIYKGIGTITGSNNLYYQNTENHVLFGDEILEDPLFVDPDSDDYHLQKESPAVNAGADVALFIDFDGDERPIGDYYDIGADEVLGTKFLFLPLILK